MLITFPAKTTNSSVLCQNTY